MSTIHPAAAEHLRRRWLRHDAHRFAKPGSPEAETGLSHPWAEVARREQAAADEAKARALAEQDEFEREVLALRHELAKLRLDYELRRFQQKYSPDQPRVPAGNSDGGQWTSGGGSGAERDSSGVPAKRPGDAEKANADVQTIVAMARRLRLAAGPALSKMPRSLLSFVGTAAASLERS